MMIIIIISNSHTKQCKHNLCQLTEQTNTQPVTESSPPKLLRAFEGIKVLVNSNGSTDEYHNEEKRDEVCPGKHFFK